MKTEFENSLRREWEKKSFPVDADHRKEMEALLKKDKRRYPVWLWWGTGVVLLSIIGFVIGYNISDKDSEIQIQKEKNLTNESVEIAQNQKNQNLQTQHDANDSDQAIVKSDNSASQDEKEIAETFKSEKEGNLQIITENQKTPKDNHTSDRVSSKERSYKDSGKSEGNTKTTSQNAQTVIGTHPQLNAIEGKSENDNNVQVHTSAPGSTINENTNSSQSVESPTSKNSNLSSTENSEISSTALPSNNLSQRSSESNLSNSNNSTEPIQSRKLVEALNFIPTLTSDIEFDRSDVEANAEPDRKHAKKWYAFADVQGAYLQKSGIVYKSGYLAGVGLGAGVRILPRLDISLRGGYMHQKNGFRFEKISSKQSPSFGARSISNSLRPTTLHFVEGFLALEYSLGRSFISLSSGVRHLYGAQGSYSVQIEDEFFGTTIEHDNFTWLNTSGLSDWYGVLGISWGYRLTRRVSANLGIQYQTPDIDKSDASLSDQGYYWTGNNRSLYPILKLQYRFYGN